MSRPAKPVLVGLFALLGLVLAAGSAIVFGSLQLFRDRQEYLMYFDESVNGLNVGAPVKFRGVPVGEVKDIRVRFQQSWDSTAIPVIVSLDLDRLRRDLGVDENMADPVVHRDQVRSGLRAQLKTLSLVTGLYYIELFYDDSGSLPKLHQRVPPGGTEYLEIPSAPSAFAGLGQSASDILAQIGQVDVAGINRRLISILDRVDGALAAIDFAALNAEMLALGESLRGRIDDPALDETIAEARRTIGAVGALAARLEQAVPTVEGEIATLSADLRETSAALRAVAARVDDLARPEGALVQDGTRALANLARLADQLRTFVDFLERNPQSLLTGRPPAAVPAVDRRPRAPEPVAAPEPSRP